MRHTDRTTAAIYARIGAISSRHQGHAGAFARTFGSEARRTVWLGTTARPKVRQHFRSSPGRMWLHRDAQIEQRTGRIDRLGSLIDRWRKNGDNSARREERSKALCCLHRAAHARCVLDPQLPISFPSSLELSLRFWPDAKDCIRRPLSSPCPEMSSCPGEIEAEEQEALRDLRRGREESKMSRFSGPSGSADIVASIARLH